MGRIREQGVAVQLVENVGMSSGQGVREETVLVLLQEESPDGPRDAEVVSVEPWGGILSKNDFSGASLQRGSDENHNYPGKGGPFFPQELSSPLTLTGVHPPPTLDVHPCVMVNML